jgi:hypothetical protein
MGIGYALASGLVQGFTQNIGREMEKRASEKERVNKLRDAILVSSVGDNFNNANVEAIQKMISSSEQQMQERGGIDLFGTRSDDILSDDEMTGLLGSLKSTTEEDKPDTYMLGGVSWNTEWTGDANSSRKWLSEVAGFSNSADFNDTMSGLTKQQVGTLSASVNAARRAVIKDEMDAQKGLTRAPDVSGTGQLYRGLNLLDDYVQNRYGDDIVDEVGATHSTDPTLFDLDAQIVLHNEQFPNSPFNSMGPTIKDIDEETGQPVEKTLIISGLMGMDAEMHNAISANLGYDDRVLFKQWTENYMTIAGINPAYKKRTLEASIEMGTTIPGIENVTPQKLPAMMDGGEAEKAVKRIASVVQDVTSGDFTMAVYALAAHLPGRKNKPQAALFGDEVIDTDVETVQGYILTKVFGEEKAKTADFKTFMDGQETLRNTSERLQALYEEFEDFRKREEDGEEIEYSMAYQAFKGKMAAYFDLDRGILGNVIRDLNPFSEGSLNLRNEDDFTLEYQQYLEQRVQGHVQRGDEKMAALEAMRISLAFEMARAADPSGRLSNQDIELQLRKLGSNFQTIGQAQAALQVSIREFEKKQQQYAVFARYASDDRAATANDYKIVDAAIAVDFLNRNGNVAAVSASAPQPEAPTIDPGDYTILNDGTSVDGNFNTITDPDIIAAVKGAST